eukprot:6648992-Prymnesium_polylepis.2
MFNLARDSTTSSKMRDLRRCLALSALLVASAKAAVNRTRPRTADPFAMVRTLGNRKCKNDVNQTHRHLCDFIQPFIGGKMPWDGDAGQNRVFNNLYDAYHRDRGNVSELLAGATLLKLVSVYPASKWKYTLEGGPGSCVLLRKMRSLGYEAVAHEISSLAIQKYCPNLPVTQGLLKHLPQARGSIDLLYSVDCIEHIPAQDIEPTFRELRRVARAGAPFFFNLGRCSKLAGGVAASNIIHASGICEEYPRSWWDAALQKAGFVRLPKDEWRAHEERAALTLAELKSRNQLPPKINARYNSLPHTWFFYRAV